MPAKVYNEKYFTKKAVCLKAALGRLEHIKEAGLKALGKEMPPHGSEMVERSVIGRQSTAQLSQAGPPLLTVYEK